jgi:aspartyl aminopeptidase
MDHDLWFRQSFIRGWRLGNNFGKHHPSFRSLLSWSSEEDRYYRSTYDMTHVGALLKTGRDHCLYSERLSHSVSVNTCFNSSSWKLTSMPWTL